MGFKRFLLVISPFYSQNVAYWTVFPAGAGYISEYLEKNRIENDIIDMRLEQSEERLFKRIEEFKPDLIGFQILTYRYDVAFNLVKNVMKKTGIKTIIGGPHVSSEKLDAMRESGADFGAKGEGEITLLELMQGKNPAHINGLMYKHDKGIKENSDRPPNHNLDNVPFPRYLKFSLEKYDKLIPIVTSRGCPYNCTFCTVKLTMGKTFRYRSPENVIKELDYWYKKGYRKFHVLDDNFTLFPDRVSKICDMIIKNKYIGIDLGLPNGVRADKLDENVLKRMKKAGFALFGIGVESGNEEILKNVNKGESLDSIEKAIDMSTKLGFDVELFFTVGNQGETKETVRESFALALKYPVADVKFYNVVPFPNTELNAWIKKHGKFRKDFRKALIFQEAYKGEPFFSTKELSFNDRIFLLDDARKLREFVLKKNMERKLGRLGYFGKMLSRIFYIGFVNKLIKDAYTKPFARRLMQSFMNIFGFNVRHF